MQAHETIKRKTNTFSNMIKTFVNKLTPIQTINQTSYLIHAIIDIPTAERRVEDIKQYFGCDTAFKNLKENVYYFCEEIKEIEYEQITEK